MLLSEKDIVYEKLPWKIDFYNSTESISRAQPVIHCVMQLWDENKPTQQIGSAIQKLNHEKVASKDQNRPTPSEEFHHSIVKDDNDLVHNLYLEAARLSALNKSKELAQDFTHEENRWKNALFVPTLVDKSVRLLAKNIVIAANGHESSIDHRSAPFLKHYEMLWKECDKTDLSEESIDLLNKGFEMINKFQKGEKLDRMEGYQMVRELYSLPMKMLTIAQNILHREQSPPT